MLRYCLDLAKRMLEANGAFFPFGAVIDANGQRLPAIVETGKPANTGEVYRLLQGSMREQYFRGEVVAGAIVADVTIPGELSPTYPEGVRIAVESSSVSRVVFLPYKKTPTVPAAAGQPVPCKCEWGELIGIDVQPTIFVRPEQK
jgi:hypothetical protein